MCLPSIQARTRWNDRKRSAEADRGLNLREVGRYLGTCAADLIKSAGEPDLLR